MKKILFQACVVSNPEGHSFHSGTEIGEIRGIEETLSDGSMAYNLEIGLYEVPCDDLKDLEQRYSAIVNATLPTNER